MILLLEDPIEDLARALATVAHAKQKYGPHPYTFHLEDVRAVLLDFGVGEKDPLIVASWLHDYIEDVEGFTYPAKYATIYQLFGRTVADLVDAVSGVGDNRKERATYMFFKVKQNPSALPLKLADRIANAANAKVHNESLFRMYQKEYSGFRTNLFPLIENDKLIETMWDKLDNIFTENNK